MKIIHTADWHLGKELHQNPLETDHTLFLEWLLDCIREQDIDVLLIAGDVFDHANPSNEARKLYFTFLTRMAALGVQVVVIGGNHDSVQMLSSSSELLDLVNVHVVGGLMQEEDRIVLPLKDKQGINRAWCVALPFLRDRDLRVYKPGESQNERIDALRSGIVNTYEHYRRKCEEENSAKLPVIGMGHLYLQGANTSESERDVQLGNAAAVPSSSLAGMFDYLALGHIHRPQQFDQGRIRYSGSPICLSFSERQDTKRVVLIEIHDSALEVQNLEVPVFRQLIKKEGQWETIRQQFEKEEQHPLPTLYDLEITAELTRVPEIEADIQKLRDRGFVIARRKITTPAETAQLSSLTGSVNDLKALQPWDVFDKKLSTQNLSTEELELLRIVYAEILEEILQSPAP